MKNPFTKENVQHATISVVCNVAGTLHFGLQAGADIVKEVEAQAVYLILKNQVKDKVIYKQHVRDVRDLMYAKDVYLIKHAVEVTATKLETAKANLALAIANVRTKLTTDTSDDVPNFGTLQ